MNSSSTERKSNVAEELANGGFYCLGNPQQSLNGDDFFSALNFPQVLGVQVSPFRQFLLGKPGFLAIKTYGLSDKLSVPQNRLSLSLGFGHCPRSVSVRGLRITPATCWYFSACLFFTTPVKGCMLEGKAVALIRGMRQCRSGSCLRLTGPRAAGNCFSSFPARQIPRERTLLPRRTQLLAVAPKAWRAVRSDERQGLWRALRVCQSWRPFRPAQSPQHNYGEGLPFRPISPGSSRRSCGMNGWFHPRLCDVSAFRPLPVTKAGWVKTNHRLKTVFFCLYSRSAGFRTGVCGIVGLLENSCSLSGIRGRGDYLARKPD